MILPLAGNQRVIEPCRPRLVIAETFHVAASCMFARMHKDHSVCSADCCSAACFVNTHCMHVCVATQ